MSLRGKTIPFYDDSRSLIEIGFSKNDFVVEKATKTKEVMNESNILFNGNMNFLAENCLKRIFDEYSIDGKMK